MAILTEEAVAGFAYAAGLRGEPLAVAVAITTPESSRDPARHNSNPATGDNSYGLWQINMIGDLGPDRRRQFGISSNDALFDPAINAKAMYLLSGGGNNFGPWSAWKARRHLPYLPAARRAAAAVEARGGTVTGSSSSSPVAAAGGDLGRSLDLVYGLPSGLQPDWDPTTSVGNFRVRGKRLSATVLAEALIGGTVDLTVDEVPEITLQVSPSSLEDAELANLLALDTPMDWADQQLVVGGLEWGEGDGGMPVLSVRLRSAGAERMRRRGTVEATWPHQSPTEVMAQRAHAAKLRFVGEGSARRDQIVRPGPGLEGEEAESDWEMGLRLARELGYWMFECGATLYFGRPSWLVTRMPEFTVNARAGVGARTDGEGARADGTLGVPTASRVSIDDLQPGDPPRTLSVPIPRERGEQVRPGMACKFGGLAGFAATYVVRSVRWVLDGGFEPAVVELATPTDPVPQPATTIGVDGLPVTSESTQAGGSGSAGVGGYRSALDMVTAALRQIGDEYVYGAEVRLDDPDPTRFDCSELIQWACAQTGVDFVDGSSNQIAAVAAAGGERTVAACSKIRGAVLWRSGHIAISLGDGVSTVEAMGRAYGVVKGTIGSRFTRGGLIPGLTYPAGS